MFNDKSEILNKLYPLSMFLFLLLLSGYELQSVIIAIQKKILRYEIMSPFLQHLDYDIELVFICGVLMFRFIQFLTEICNRFVVLA
jgi:hypothetical protein